MKLLNFKFENKENFLSNLKHNAVNTKERYLIQLFIGNNNIDFFKKTIKEINDIFPNSQIIAASTAGEIIDGNMLENSIVVSLSQFENSDFKTILIEEKNENDTAIKIYENLTKDSKLIILFNNPYENDAQAILTKLQHLASKITIAGGNAADNRKFDMKTVVGTGEKISTKGVAVSIIDSKILNIYNDYLFNWQKIGNKFKITKADKNIVYLIDGISPKDLYRKYLGDEIADDLPAAGVEFPLMFKENGMDIARAPVAVGQNGEFILAGQVKEGYEVQIGFGDIELNDKNTKYQVGEFAKNPVESIYIYSCSARKYLMENHLNDEFRLLNSVAPTAGFITYGEFFTNKSQNLMLNITSTFLGLSENPDRKNTLSVNPTTTDKKTKTLKALTHLIQQTSYDLENKISRLHFFKNMLKQSTIFSKTDINGIITEVNKNFEKISGYTKDELIGKTHAILRHKDVPKKFYEDLWDTILSKNVWSGILKNKNKKGQTYYLKAHIFPELDTQGNITEFVSIKDNITDTYKKEQKLLGNIHKLKEKEYILKQYETIIDESNALCRIDPYFNILYVNDAFCSIFECQKKDFVNKKKFIEIIDRNFLKTEFSNLKAMIKYKRSWKGLMPLVKDKKDNNKIYMETTIRPIINNENKIVEFVIVQNDITDLITAQKEIEDTQRDIIYTMGAIGETRSRETGNHVSRVAEYSKILALKYGFSKKEAELLKIASPMHDIGKIAIPDNILNKPGKLTQEEWEVMKTHCQLGYEMLKNSNREIIRTAATVALTHHEKYDGTGYPNGFKAKNIPIVGRITALADVFDALGSDRVYKKAWKDNKIFSYIKEQKGKHFDPKLVDIFFKNLDDFLNIRAKFK